MNAGLVGLIAGAFLLGSCPFSVWIGEWFLGKDIRCFGDGNPGSGNVFRAGGKKLGLLAVAMDMGKGMPFVLIASHIFGLPDIETVVVALSAILGSAFSPLLRVWGGKSIAITYGTMVVLPDHEILFVFILLMLLGFLFIEVDAWTVMVAPVGSLAYFMVTRGNSWESLYILGVLIILLIKYFKELQTGPRFGSRLTGWLQSKRQ